MAPLAEILELEIDKTVCNNDIIDESAVDPMTKTGATVGYNRNFKTAFCNLQNAV